MCFKLTASQLRTLVVNMGQARLNYTEAENRLVQPFHIMYRLRRDKLFQRIKSQRNTTQITYKETGRSRAHNPRTFSVYHSAQTLEKAEQITANRICAASEHGHHNKTNSSNSGRTACQNKTLNMIGWNIIIMLISKCYSHNLTKY